MARVFLSYAREDVETARRLAGVLSDAGQTVWWDRHVHGGANFGNEIDRELKNAQIVMVLWSPASIASAWVQDEAAEGRDSGRLVPAVIDKSTADHYAKSGSITDYKLFPARSHWTIAEPGWEEVADYALDWATRNAAVPVAAQA